MAVSPDKFFYYKLIKDNINSNNFELFVMNFFNHINDSYWYFEPHLTPFSTSQKGREENEKDKKSNSFNNIKKIFLNGL